MKKNSVVFIILVFISTLTNAQVDHWETAVYSNDVWHYILGESEPPSDWPILSFNDSSWSQGEGSIGYADDDDNTIIDPTESLYMRRKFTVTDKSKIEAAIFHADFDDGFVAYLNGVEIARNNLEGNPPTHDQWATGLREALVYQGGLPIAINLSSVSLQQILIDGDNVLAIQTHNFEGQSSSDMTSLYWLSFGITDTSTDYGPTPDWFVGPSSIETPLPIVKINTWGEYIPDEPSINGEMGIIWNGDGLLNSSTDSLNEFLGNISIERRGQSSLALYPKNGYAIETKDANWEDIDVDFLNFPPEEDWILHGPYADKSLIRNVVAMQMARSMGQYASRTRLVELMINESYEGVYVLMEKIKRDESRLDIANLKPEDISGDELTGGYIIKCDKGEFDWESDYDIVNNPGAKLKFQYVSPKRSQIEPQQENYIQSYVDSFENAVSQTQSTYGGKYYYEYIDLVSFADHFLLQELVKNTDAYRISFYMYKDKDSKGGLLSAGPAWDFNFTLGMPDYCESNQAWAWMYDRHCDIGNPFWWGEMMQDDVFRNTVKCRWLEHRENGLSLDTLFAFIDEKVSLLEPLVDRNFERWPILNEYVWPNAAIPGSFQGEIDYMKNFLTDRWQWIDNNVFGSCTVTTEEVETKAYGFKVYPNPVADDLFMELNSAKAGTLEIKIYDVLGRQVLSENKNNILTGTQQIQVDLRNVNSGSTFFIVELSLEGNSLGRQQFVKLN